MYERISKSGIGDKEDQREKAKVIHVKIRKKGTCYYSKKNGRCTSSRKEMERKTGNKMDMSREEGQLLRRMVDVPVAGKRWRGRQQTRWTCQEKKGSC